MQYEDWEYHPSKLPADDIEKQKALKELEQKFFEEISQNPKAVEYMKAYHPSSAAHFFQAVCF